MSGFGGAGFSVMDNTQLGTVWVPVDGTASIYTGQLVYLGLQTPADSGVVNLGQAGGFADITTRKIPYGVVIGNNNKTKLYNSTYKTDYITAVDTAAAQLLRDWRGVEGMYAKGDPCPMAHVALIGPGTVLRGRLMTTAYGTVPTEKTITTATSTVAFVSAAIDVATVAYNSTVFFRSGANMGIYRIVSSASDTTHTLTKAMPQSPVVGDKFVMLPVRQGTCRVQTDAQAMFIDCVQACTTHFWLVDGIEVHAETAGEEYFVFKFNMSSLLSSIAAT